MPKAAFAATSQVGKRNVLTFNTLQKGIFCGLKDALLQRDLPPFATRYAANGNSSGRRGGVNRFSTVHKIKCRHAALSYKTRFEQARKMRQDGLHPQLYEDLS